MDIYADQLWPEIRRCLSWIRDTEHTVSEWRVNGKSIKREPPDKWTHLHLSGAMGSIAIPNAVVKATRPYTRPAPVEARRIFGLNTDGVLLLENEPKQNKEPS